MNDVKNWIEEWCNLYPDDVKWNGIKVKSSPKDVIKKMEKFCKENNFSKETIFQATRNYVENCFKNNWQYMKRATYFISKVNEDSLLKNYCEELGKEEKYNTNEFI